MTSEGDDGLVSQVGQVLEVVSSIDMVPQRQYFPDIQEPFQRDRSTTSKNDVPVQFVKVNVFKHRSVLSDGDFPGEDYSHSSTSSGGGWQVLVQLEQYDWILADAITNLSFVILEEDVRSHCYDDCHGMRNFFVLKYRLARNGCVSSVPWHSCPPFPGQIEGFSQSWCIDHCHLIFNSIRQIGRALQHIMCCIAQSQGDFSTRNAKLQLPSCSWFYIKNQTEQQDIASIPRVRFSQPRPILSWGLMYHCIRESGDLEVLRFDTTSKMNAFCDVFGQTSGYGVRKKGPWYWL
jgi:hypothetical protein